MLERVVVRLLWDGGSEAPLLALNEKRKKLFLSEERLFNGAPEH